MDRRRQRNRRWGRRLGAAIVSGAPVLYGAWRGYGKTSTAPVPAPAYIPRTVASSYIPRRRRRKVQTFPKKVKKQIKELKRIAEADMGTHIERERSVARALCGVNAMSMSGYSVMGNAAIERMLAKLKYYDIATPATLVTASGVTGTYTKDFYISRCYSKFTARNNYQVPCKVKIFFCTPKTDTSITALSAFTNGLTDAGNPTVTSPLVQLTDSPQFGELWKIASSKSVTLQPGQECVLTNSFKEFQYDPSLVDSQTLAFQPKYGANNVLLRLEGVLGHDSVEATEQTTLQAGLEVMYETTLECKYAAGIDLYTVSILNNADTTFTNVGVASSKPLADNQSYSVI